MAFLGIREWPADDRPREKLQRLGEHRLSNAELLAILLGTGNRGETALDLARRVLGEFGSWRNMGHTDGRRWQRLKGLGPAKTARIKAAVEIGRRFGEEETAGTRPRVRSSKDAADMLTPRLRDLKYEVFKVVLLNNQNRVIDAFEAAQGTVNHASPVIREIFQRALERFAAAMICAHNHPSGEARPSREDEAFTRRLCEAGRIMQVKVLDHLIIGDGGYYSFADDGRLRP